MASRKSRKLIRKLVIPTSLLVILFTVIAYFSVSSPSPSQIRVKADNTNTSLWEYECIDTMKTSRDKARVWRNWDGLEEQIAAEITTIVEMGANCVALDTPYDVEFLPYLEKWVQAARAAHLKIWYRGNFSAWEGWFEYPEDMGSEELFAKTRQFILSNPDLFRDGDIFTPAPEAENGGPFDQVETDEHAEYRRFLKREHDVAEAAFDEIGRDVTVNWMSMNGGLAMRMMDQDTVDALGGVVTIDHYIRTAPEMGEFIEYFANNFGAKVAVGEFGAPIPDINGPMTPREQAAFVEELFAELYRHRRDVVGVNYWILYDGSTALLDSELAPLPVVDVVKKYFHPTVVQGRVQNTLGEPVENAQIQISGIEETFSANSNGEFEFTIPQGEYNITVSAQGYNSESTRLPTEQNTDVIQATLEPIEEDLWYKINSSLE